MMTSRICVKSSVISTATRPNSSVSLVMRLTMRPDWYWSKKLMSWFITDRNASVRIASTTALINCTVKMRRAQLSSQLPTPITSTPTTSAISSVRRAKNVVSSAPTPQATSTGSSAPVNEITVTSTASVAIWRVEGLK